MRDQIRRQHYYLYVLLTGIVLSLSLFLVLKPSAHAATINVVAGTDAINDNGQCQLSEAVQNINDQAQTNDDCVAGDGNNDTIQMSAGTITLTENSYLGGAFNPGYQNSIEFTRSFRLIGASTSGTIINGANEFGLIALAVGIDATFQNFSLINPDKELGIGSLGAASTTIDRVKIDGNSTCTASPITVGDATSTSTTIVNINNVHITDFSCTLAESGALIGLNVDNVGGGNLDLTAANITIDNLSAELALVGMAYGVNTQTLVTDDEAYGTVGADISNVTINNLSSDALAVGFGANAINLSSSSNVAVNSTINNVTLSNIQSGAGELTPDGSPVTIPARAFGFQGVSYGSGTTISTVNVKNMLVVNSIHNGESVACGDLNFNNTATITINSLGGNITEDATCDFMNAETDRTSQSDLSPFLGSLANNGGSIPTIALLPGNPAIDGGVCGEGVPTTDARGMSRPQGATCDSGAFEVQQATPSGTVAGGKAVAVNVPAGVVVNEFGTVSGSIPTDNRGDAEYEFPLGLLSFELTVPESSTNEISLDFESDRDPESVVTRKYNPSDQTFTTLTNATITKITKDNKPTLRLTYSLTDGEFPDLDAQANGTIIDPIGLAVEKKGVLANTGLAGIIIAPFGIIITSLAIATYIDYRKHKKPLMEADPYNASTYTYWHHLKTVTIPLFSYRLSFAFEAKRSSNP